MGGPAMSAIGNKERETQNDPGSNDFTIAEEVTVKGFIIALEDDIRIKRALSVAMNIEFYRYQVSFKLIKGSS